MREQERGNRLAGYQVKYHWYSTQGRVKLPGTREYVLEYGYTGAVLRRVLGVPGSTRVRAIKTTLVQRPKREPLPAATKLPREQVPWFTIATPVIQQTQLEQ